MECEKINKLGIVVAGKLFIFRRVSNLRRTHIPWCDDDSVYAFDVQIKRNHEWITESVEVKGKIVFTQG